VKDQAAGQNEPWYRAGQPWALIAVVIAMIVVAWPSLTREPGSFDFWLWSVIVVLVAAWAGSLRTLIFQVQLGVPVRAPARPARLRDLEAARVR
jgi:hypothetical protein